jgi:lipopolysaccharide biosynthesis glycosyltransferase
MQKVLLASLPWVQQYDKVLIIDADILMNPEAPNIFDECPPGKICAVDERSQYGSTQNIVNAWKKIGTGTLPGTAEDYYKRLGFPGTFSKQFNSGFIVFEPKTHKEFFESVYTTYMPRIFAGEDLDGDQGPLNYEGNRHGLVHYLDERWNRVWLFTHVILYPFLHDKENLQKAISTTFHMNYALHFTGGYGWDLLIN